MPEVTLPVPASVNHLHRNVTTKTGRRIQVKTNEAKRWDATASLIVRVACKKAGWKTREAGQKVVVELWAFWPNGRRRDMNNLHKQVADVLELGGVYADDAWALLRDIDFTVDRENPRIVVRWSDV